MANASVIRTYGRPTCRNSLAVSCVGGLSFRAEQGCHSELREDPWARGNALVPTAHAGVARAAAVSSPAEVLRPQARSRARVLPGHVAGATLRDSCHRAPRN